MLHFNINQLYEYPAPPQKIVNIITIMLFVCPCPSHRRKASNPLLVERDTASLRSDRGSTEEAIKAMQKRTTASQPCRRHRITSFSFEHNSMDRQGKWKAPSWFNSSIVNPSETITNGSTYDQDAVLLSLNTVKHDNTSKELKKAYRDAKQVSDRLRGEYATQSSYSSLKRSNAVRERNWNKHSVAFDNSTSVVYDFIAAENELPSRITCQEEPRSVRQGESRDLRQISIRDVAKDSKIESAANENLIDRYSGDKHGLQEHPAPDILEAGSVSFMDQNSSRTPEIQNTLELEILNSSISEIIIPPTSPTRRASSQSFNSQLSRRSSSNKQHRSHSYQYSGHWTPASLPTYKISKAPRPDQYIGIVKRKDSQKLGRASKFKENFSNTELGIDACYDGAHDGITSRLGEYPIGHSRTAAGAKYDTEHDNDGRPQTMIRDLPNIDLGIWSHSFSMYQEELQCPKASGVNQSTWSAKRRSSLHPLGSSGIEIGRSHECPSATASKNSLTVNVNHSPMSQTYPEQYLRIPGALNSPQASTNSIYSQHIARSQHSTRPTFAEIQEDEEEDDLEDEVWPSPRRIRPLRSACPLPSTSITPDSVLRSKASGEAWSIRSVETADIAPDDNQFLRLQPSFRTVATSQIGPHDTSTPQFFLSNDSSDRSIESWCKFPSHTRAERIGSAGFEDKVDTHDFVEDHLEFRPAPRKHYEMPTLREQRPKGVLKHVKELWLNERGDSLRLQQGTRSSISVGGQVRYPDLELLPKLEREYVSPPDQRVTSSYYSNDQELSPKFDVVDYEGSGYGSDLDIQTIPDQDDHTSALSRMYRQTIFGGSSMGSDSAEPSRQASFWHSDVSLNEEPARQRAAGRPNLLSPECTSRHPVNHRRTPSPSNSETSMAVRRSTLDFTRDLKQHKVQSHQSLLETIEALDSHD